MPLNGPERTKLASYAREFKLAVKHSKISKQSVTWVLVEHEDGFKTDS